MAWEVIVVIDRRPTWWARQCYGEQHVNLPDLSAPNTFTFFISNFQLGASRFILLPRQRYFHEHFRIKFDLEFCQRARASRVGPLSCSSHLPSPSEWGWIWLGSKAFWISSKAG